MSLAKWDISFRWYEDKQPRTIALLVECMLHKLREQQPGRPLPWHIEHNVRQIAQRIVETEAYLRRVEAYGSTDEATEATEATPLIS